MDSHETNRLITTAVDALGRPLNALLQDAPSWFRTKPELTVQVSDTPKSSLDKDMAIVQNMALEGKTKEETQAYLLEHSTRMQGFETQDQKEAYFNTVLEGARQTHSVAFAKEKGLDLSLPKQEKGLTQEL